jgi:ketosteroid isomerase-like protein
MTASDLSLDVERDCSRLCIAFANGVDAHDNAVVLELFTDDAMLVTPARTYQGRAKIAGFLDARPASVVTRHLCTNIRISTQSESSATGQCCLQFFSVASEAAPVFPLKAPAPVVAEYRDEYLRTPAGWRIRHRRIEIVFVPG